MMPHWAAAWIEDDLVPPAGYWTVVNGDGEGVCNYLGHPIRFRRDSPVDCETAVAMANALNEGTVMDNYGSKPVLKRMIL